MKNLIIDAANEKIFFSIITEIQSYTTTHVNSRENFDKFINLLLDFLRKNKIKLDDVENIFINQGPGKFSGIRISISIAKAISIAKNISLFGFNLKDLDNEDYKKLLKLHKKDLLNKNLIKPLYLS
jgi:tRNA A37 threonylcarbamoyladenosine modification protein TsaB